MGRKQGLDPGAATTARGSLGLQIAALSDIASQLAITHTAASAPESHGIAPGEPVVAPWSLSSLLEARDRLTSAESAAGTLLQRIQSEVDAQVAASGNDFANLGGVRPVIDSVRWWRNWVAMPRSFLEVPAALRMLRNQPALWRTLVQPKSWLIRSTLDGGTALRNFTRTTQTPKGIRAVFQAASNLKWQNYLDPAYVHSRGLHTAPPKWTKLFHVDNPGFVSGAKTVAAGVGKGFGVLGVGVGVLDIATGVNGMMDGDVSSADAWALADGMVGTITNIGSFAPPPAGLVFAGVGAGYTAGRWLFGSDENGRTGIDKIGDFGDAAGGAISGAASNVGDAVSDGADAVEDFVEDKWPW